MKIAKKVFWIIVIVLFCISVFDFYRVRNGNKPMFTIIHKEHNYDDGKTFEYIGLGYKVYQYQRTNLHGTEFVSWFGHEKEPEIVRLDGDLIE